MKNLLMVIVMLFVLENISQANQKRDIVLQGCTDIMKNRWSDSSSYVTGFVLGTEWIAFDVMNKMGKSITVSIDSRDIKDACKFLLSNRYDLKNKHISSAMALSFIIRGNYVRMNGYTWDEVQAKVREIQKKIGTYKQKKKY